MYDCNGCKHLNMTEDEQRAITGGNLLMHKCMFYGRKITHHSHEKSAYYLFPCEECRLDKFKNYTTKQNKDLVEEV